MIRIALEALQRITHPRFFETERGFQGEFQANIRATIPATNQPDAIVEEEYQKCLGTHGIRRRPDVIVHVPTPPGQNCRLGNLAVFELKLAARPAEARQDFKALDDIIDAMDYPFGAFINIASKRTHADQYCGRFQGRFPERVHFFAVWREDGQTRVKHACYNDTGSVEETIFPRPITP